jgi:hypothetical protein
MKEIETKEVPSSNPSISTPETHSKTSSDISEANTRIVVVFAVPEGPVRANIRYIHAEDECS